MTIKLIKLNNEHFLPQRNSKVYSFTQKISLNDILINSYLLFKILQKLQECFDLFKNSLDFEKR